MKKSIRIWNKVIDDNWLYFIADIWANHDWSLDKAIELIHLAKKSWADAAKFQNFTANKIVSKIWFENMKNELSHQSKWKKSVFDVYESASISWDWTKALKDTCDEVWIDYFTSPYDFDSVDLVDPYVELYKVGSGDITWLEIIDYILSKDKPVLIATWASSNEDVKRVMELALSKKNDIVLMQCNTNYTGNLENLNFCNLNVLKQYSKDYPNIMLWLSDHTHWHATVLWSIALWARVIEKHFTYDNKAEWPDHGFAMDPSSWENMVDRSYELLNALWNWIKRVEGNEIDSQIVQRRCIRINKSCKKWYILKKDDFIVLRPIPKDWIPPYEMNSLVWKELLNNINNWEHLTFKMLK